MSSTGPDRAKRWVRCPSCGKQALYAEENPARPFCSSRCRSVDLGAWASEGYRLASRTQPDEDGPEAPAAPTH